MSIIQHILKEELERLEELAHKYENEIRNLPKGSLSRKKRNGKAYLYFAYRDKDKVKFKYVGRESSKVAKIALAQREQRLKYDRSLRQVKKDIKEIKGALNGRW